MKLFFVFCFDTFGILKNYYLLEMRRFRYWIARPYGYGSWWLHNNHLVSAFGPNMHNLSLTNPIGLESSETWILNNGKLICYLKLNVLFSIWLLWHKLGKNVGKKFPSLQCPTSTSLTSCNWIICLKSSSYQCENLIKIGRFSTQKL